MHLPAAQRQQHQRCMHPLQQFSLEFSVFSVLDLSFSCLAPLFLFSCYTVIESTSISLAPSTVNFLSASFSVLF
jgi:hypothetical protein